MANRRLNNVVLICFLLLVENFQAAIAYGLDFNPNDFSNLSVIYVDRDFTKDDGDTDKQEYVYSIYANKELTGALRVGYYYGFLVKPGELEVSSKITRIAKGGSFSDFLFDEMMIGTTKGIAEIVSGKNVHPATTITLEINPGNIYFISCHPSGKSSEFKEQVSMEVVSPSKGLQVIRERRTPELFDLLYENQNPIYVTMSPISKRIAYVVTKQVKNHFEFAVVVDGKEGQQYSWIENSIVFSPDGTRIGYWAKKDKKIVVVVDGVEGQPYKEIGSIVFSTDSKRVAYLAKRDNDKKWVVVVDGVEGQPYKDIDQSVVFSPDGNKIAYATEKDKKRLLMIGGNELQIPSSAIISNIIFSPDGNRVAYIATKWDKFFAQNTVGVDGKEGQRYDKIYGSPVFSPDSNRIAYVAQKDNKKFIVIDGNEGQPYDDVDNIVFSPDSKHVACGIKKDKKWIVLSDGNEGQPYDEIDSIVFSPDSNRLTCKVREDEKWFYVNSEDGEKMPDNVPNDNPVSSTDSKGQETIK